MFFPHGVTVHRQRPRPVFDPMSGAMIDGDWTDPLEVEIPGAAIAQSSTATLDTDGRTAALEAMSLYCEVGTDIQHGDRIRAGIKVYPTDGIPATFVNPFTGWEAGMEVPLGRVIG